MGRFINADSYTSTGQGILGNNMFAYCLNTPVVLADSSGTAAHIGFSAAGQIHDAPWRIGSPGGGGWPQGVCLSVNHLSEDDSLSFSDVLAILFNDDEQAVLEAEYFAFYKGQLVIKQNWAFTDGRSFSFGIMFLHENENTGDIVKHEWGHYVQLWGLGLEGYIVNVAIPSVLSDGLDPYYFSNPWERSADFFGGVDRGDEYRKGSSA